MPFEKIVFDLRCNMELLIMKEKYGSGFSCN